jgi:hypothetical protein
MPWYPPIWQVDKPQDGILTLPASARRRGSGTTLLLATHPSPCQGLSNGRVGTVGAAFPANDVLARRSSHAEHPALSPGSRRRGYGLLAPAARPMLNGNFFDRNRYDL